MAGNYAVKLTFAVKFPSDSSKPDWKQILSFTFAVQKRVITFVLGLTLSTEHLILGYSLTALQCIYLLYRTLLSCILKLFLNKYKLMRMIM